MKRKLQILGASILFLFITAPLTSAQGNMQNDTTSDTQGNMQTDRNSNTMSSDTSNSDNAEAYYNYAKKNVIEDKSPDKEYQGKWTDSSKTETSKAENEEWNGSGSSMDNGKNKMSMKNDQMNKMKRDSSKNMNKIKNDSTNMNKMKNDAGNKMNKMKNDSTKNMNKMKNDAQEKTNDMKNDTENKMDTLNQNGQYK